MHEITLSGPGKNALGTATMQFLLDELAKAAGRPVLLTGAGDGFSAGLNLKELAQLDAAGMERFIEQLERLMVTLYTYPGPTVAAVNGHAIAGGAILALCCDYRIGAFDTSIKIGLNEVALGLHFPPKIMAICRDRIPPQHQATVLLAAGLHPPQSALVLGLLDELAADVRGVAVERLQKLASHPAHAYAATKGQLRDAVVAVPKEVEADFMSKALPHWTSEELKARIVALLER